MTKVALIPARGGSKRLPRKNILPIDGVPMLVYPIRTAQQSGLFDEIYVSTEDIEIAKVSQEAGAKVIYRPRVLAEDHSTVVQVCLHTLKTYPEIERICCIYATAILLTPQTLKQSYSLLDAEPIADFIMGVSTYEYSPVQALKIDEEGYLSYMWPQWSGIQSQFYPNLLVSNGTFYWSNRDALIEEKSFYGRRLKGYIVSPNEVSDINTPEDLARVVYKLQCNLSPRNDYE
ncbi:pseudaminic acid cytidylyltransferase [Synechococcus moorigangaii CMS01]|nr:pseudaminic acid cytidylyltransferase [Synechococcus moorigangaii CMS01]